MKKLFFIIIISFLIISCKKDDSVTIQCSLSFGIVFQHEYINYAWGYQHHGWVIDSSGYIRSFSMPHIWHFPDTNGILTRNEMHENMLQLDSTHNRVNHDTLLKYFKLLIKAQNGKISEPRNEMYDAGVAEYAGFLYDTSTDKYKKVFIQQWGDFCTENESEEAKQIYSWLLRVDTKRSF